MNEQRKISGRSRVKIGTILDKSTMNRLKERSAREGRAISALIEEAVLKYETENSMSRDLRLHALERLFDLRFDITDEDWNAIMKEDYFEQ